MKWNLLNKHLKSMCRVTLFVSVLFELTQPIDASCRAARILSKFLYFFKPYLNI